MAELPQFQAAVQAEYSALCQCLGLSLAFLDVCVTNAVGAPCCGHQREEAGYRGACETHVAGVLVIPIDPPHLAALPTAPGVVFPAACAKRSPTVWPDWRVSLYHEVCHQVQDQVYGLLDGADGYSGHNTNWWEAVAWVSDKLQFPPNDFGIITAPPPAIHDGRMVRSEAPKPPEWFFQGVVPPPP